MCPNTAKIQDARKTVVIAEDSTQSRKCILTHLETLGYDVVGEAKDGEEAVRLTEEHHPSLVVLDIKMPRMNGIEAAKAITASGPVPIILVTGLATDEFADEAIEAGVFAYLIKPISKKQLQPAIKLAMARYKEFTVLKSEVADLKDAIEARKLIERAKGILMKRCKIGEDDAYKLLQTQSQKENRKMKDVADMVISASKII